MLIRRLRWVFLFVGFSLLGNVWAAPWLGEFSMFGRYGTVQGGAGGEMDGSFGRLNSFGYVGGYGRIGWDQEGLNHRLGAMFARSESWFGGILLRAYGEWDGAQLTGYARGQFALGSSLRWRKVDGWVNVYPFAYGKGRTEQDRGRGKLEDGELLFPTENWDVVRNYTDFGGRLYLWKGLYVGGRGKLLKNPDGDLGFGGDGLFGLHMGLWGPVDGRLEAVTGYDTANGFVVKARIGVGYILGERERSVTSLPVVQRVYEASSFSWKSYGGGGKHRTFTFFAHNDKELRQLLHNPNVKTVVIQGEILLPQGIEVPYGVTLAGGEGSFTAFDGHVVDFTVTDAPSDTGLTMKGKGPVLVLAGDNSVRGFTLKANGNIAVSNVHDEGSKKSGFVDLLNMTIEDGILDLRTGKVMKTLSVRLLNNTYRLTGNVALTKDLTSMAADTGKKKTPIHALVQLSGEDNGLVKIVASGQRVEGKLEDGDPLGLLALAGNVGIERNAVMFDKIDAPEGNFLFLLASVGAKDPMRHHTLTVLKRGHVAKLGTIFWANAYTEKGQTGALENTLGFDMKVGSLEVGELGSGDFDRNFLTVGRGSRIGGNITIEELKVGTWHPDASGSVFNLSGLRWEGGSVRFENLTFGKTPTVISKALFDLSDMTGSGGDVGIGTVHWGGMTLGEHASVVDLHGTSMTKSNKGFTLAFPPAGTSLKVPVSVAHTAPVLNLNGASGDITLKGTLEIKGANGDSLVTASNFNGRLDASRLFIEVHALGEKQRGALLFAPVSEWKANSGLPGFKVQLAADTIFKDGFSYVYMPRAVLGGLLANFNEISFDNSTFKTEAGYITLFDFSDLVRITEDENSRDENSIVLRDGTIKSAGTMRLTILDMHGEKDKPVEISGILTIKLENASHSQYGLPPYITVHGLEAVPRDEGKSLFNFRYWNVTGGEVNGQKVRVLLDEGDYSNTSGIFVNLDGLRLGSGQIFLPLEALQGEVHVWASGKASFLSARNVQITGGELDKLSFNGDGGTLVIDGPKDGFYTFIDGRNNEKDLLTDADYSVLFKVGEVRFEQPGGGWIGYRAPEFNTKNTDKYKLQIDFIWGFAKQGLKMPRGDRDMRLVQLSSKKVALPKGYYLEVSHLSKIGTEADSSGLLTAVYVEDGAVQGTIDIDDKDVGLLWNPYHLLRFGTGASMASGSVLSYAAPSKFDGPKIVLDQHFQGGSTVSITGNDGGLGVKGMAGGAVRVEFHNDFAGTLVLKGDSESDDWVYGPTKDQVLDKLFDVSHLTSAAKMPGKIEIEGSAEVRFGGWEGLKENLFDAVSAYYKAEPKLKGKIIKR